MNYLDLIVLNVQERSQKENKNWLELINEEIKTLKEEGVKDEIYNTWFATG